MTAEIAILNKTAVALAADSAVTISAGRKEEKIFDSADKLFELSNHNPIGIMIYNGMSFMEAPLPSLIRQFRTICPRVHNVEDAANKFLLFLNEFGERSPEIVKQASVKSIVSQVLTDIMERFNKKLQNRFFSLGKEARHVEDYQPIFEEILDTEINLYLHVFRSCENASFVGSDRPVSITRSKSDLLKRLIAEQMPIASQAQAKKLLEITKLSLRKNILSRGRTGIVVAGFGDRELFPTLFSFELDGMVCDRLKYVKTNCVDIDRQGTKAKVLPFAQKEMVERFLYGLDDKIQKEVTKFCQITIPDIRNGIINEISFENEGDKAEIGNKAQEAESAFLSGLKEKAFEKIRDQSQAEIEDMVEFMPKPELAKMAEALVNLTSIKRRVSRGVETVGGPIDVAVISQAEGFVWVKRKHYFPPDLNSRYFERVRAGGTMRQGENGDGKAPKPRSSNTRTRAKTEA